MKNAWFFGDSFTAGFGYNFEEYLDLKSSSFEPKVSLDEDSPVWENPKYIFSKFNEWKTKYCKDIWTYLVSDHLNLSCINKGESGSTNERIIHNIIRYLNDIKKGDTVFIGSTTPYRLLTPHRNSPTEEGIMRSSMINLTTLKPLNLKDSPKDQYSIPGFFSDKEREVILDYLFYINMREHSIIDRYYKKRFDSLVKFFNSNGIKTFFWDYTHWGGYDSIAKYTNNRVKDGHWAITSHKEFSQKVIEYLKEGRTEMINNSKYLKYKIKSI